RSLDRKLSVYIDLKVLKRPRTVGVVASGCIGCRRLLLVGELCDLGERRRRPIVGADLPAELGEHLAEPDRELVDYVRRQPLRWVLHPHSTAHVELRGALEQVELVVLVQCQQVERDDRIARFVHRTKCEPEARLIWKVQVGQYVNGYRRVVETHAIGRFLNRQWTRRLYLPGE